MEKLGGDTKQVIDQLDLGENVALFRSFHLPFFDHVHRLIACQCALRRIKGKEPQARPGAAFDEAVVLLDQIVEVFELPQLTRWRELLVGFERVHGLGVDRVLVDVDHTRRTAEDYARQLQWLADVRYPEAKKIRLVQDNLNTHRLANLYLVFPPAEARRLAERFETHYTPTHGSWLDLADIEIGILNAAV